MVEGINPNILYEDNHLLVAEKPPNMPVQADASGDMDFLTVLKRYVKYTYQKPGEAYLGLCHRLDRPVGGVMVFARTSKAAERLGRQFAGREAQKRYVALVSGNPPQSGMLVDYIRACEGALRVEVAKEPQEGYKEAKLRFEVIARGKNETLLHVILLTGRKHQIRAQLAAHGYPIRHDQRYEPNASRGQIALWAYSLAIIHPVKKERMEFFSLPKGGAFAPYATQIAGLPAYAACDFIYRDRHILAVAKKTGVEVAKFDGGEQSLEHRLGELIGKVYPVHRLDAHTQGVLLFARTREAQEALDAAFRAGLIEKHYECAVYGRVEQDGAILDAWAKKDAEAARLYVYDEKTPGSQPIKTEYHVKERLRGHTVLAVRLHTGRTHQIRAHMAHIGHPVLGDDKYGNRDANKRARVKKQALLAKKLVLHLPDTASESLRYLEGMAFRCPWGLQEIAFKEDGYGI